MYFKLQGTTLHTYPTTTCAIAQRQCLKVNFIALPSAEEGAVFWSCLMVNARCVFISSYCLLESEARETSHGSAEKTYSTSSSFSTAAIFPLSSWAPFAGQRWRQPKSARSHETPGHDARANKLSDGEGRGGGPITSDGTRSSVKHELISGGADRVG